MTSGYWQDLTTRDLPPGDVEGCVALLPVSAVEQHGPHLPLATDATINDALVRAVLARGVDPARLLVLPAMTVGHSPEHADFPGTLAVGAEALLASWVAVGRGVARAGVRKLVILNSHGGQIPLVDLAALRLRAEQRMLVARVTTFRLGSPQDLFEADEIAHGLHGGEVETSLMLHIDPGAVRRDALADFEGLPQRWSDDGRVLGVERPAGIGWMAQDLNPHGVCGRAGRADAARGEALLAHWTESMVTLVRELAATPLGMLADGPG